MSRPDRAELHALCARWGWSRTQPPAPVAVAFRLGDATHELREAMAASDADATDRALAKLESLERSLDAYAKLFKTAELEAAAVSALGAGVSTVPEARPAPAPVTPALLAPVVLVASEPAPPPIRAISRIEGARRCGVSLSTFDSYVRTAIGEVRIGGRLVFLESDIETFLLKEAPATADTTKPAVRVKRARRRDASATTITDPKALAILDRFKTKAVKGRGDATH